MPETTILVTGAAGFLGRNMLDVLAGEAPGAHVVAAGHDVEDAPDPRLVDLTDADAVARLVGSVRPEVVFHLAGTAPSASWEALYASHVSTTKTVCGAIAATLPACRVVVPGSAAEYGKVPVTRMPIVEDEVLRPVTPYGVAKAWQSRIALSFVSKGVEVIVGRPFNVLGPGTPKTLVAGAVAEQLRAIRSGDAAPELRVGNLEARRDFIDVADACRAFAALWRAGAPGEVYNVCSGVPTRVGDLVSRMVELSGTGARIVVESGRLRAADVDESVGSPAKLEQATGWRPSVPLDESIRRTLGLAGLA